jgi:hypothetical protein
LYIFWSSKAASPNKTIRNKENTFVKSYIKLFFAKSFSTRWKHSHTFFKQASKTNRKERKKGSNRSKGKLPRHVFQNNVKEIKAKTDVMSKKLRRKGKGRNRIVQKPKNRK